MTITELLRENPRTMAVLIVFPFLIAIEIIFRRLK